jgi:hypothetical protein
MCHLDVVVATWREVSKIDEIFWQKLEAFDIFCHVADMSQRPGRMFAFPVVRDRNR